MFKLSRFDIYHITQRISQYKIITMSSNNQNLILQNFSLLLIFSFYFAPNIIVGHPSLTLRTKPRVTPRPSHGPGPTPKPSHRSWWGPIRTRTVSSTHRSQRWNSRWAQTHSWDKPWAHHPIRSTHASKMMIMIYN